MAKIATRLSDSASSVNRTDGVAPAVAFNIKETLKQAGWVHRGSGTGTAGTFSTTAGNVNDQITNTGTGAGGMDRANAWFALSDPGGRREWMFQRLATSNTWRVYYSALDKFIGVGFGAVSATVPPSATDQQQIVGAADAGAIWMPTPDNTYLHHVVAQDAVEPGGNVYGWWLATTIRGTGETTTFMFQEPLKSGSYPAADTDPTIVCWGGVATLTHSSIYHNTTTISATVPKGYYKQDLAGEAWQTYSACMLGHADAGTTNTAPTQNLNSDGLATDPYDQSEVEADIVWGRANTQFGGVNGGLKGIGSGVRWATAGFRRYPAVYNRATDARVVLHGNNAVLTFPWPDGVVASYG